MTPVSLNAPKRTDEDNNELFRITHKNVLSRSEGECTRPNSVKIAMVLRMAVKEMVTGIVIATSHDIYMS